MRRTAWIMGVLASAGLLSGCVERRFVVTSEPPGAVVLHNNQPVGPAPADESFVYYGNHHFTLVRDGYETLQVDQAVPSPWYEYPGLDFISENLVPWTIRDVRRLTFPLQPLQKPNLEAIGARAQELRNRGQNLAP